MPIANPATVPVQPAPEGGQLFTAPPAVSTDGVVFDPFASSGAGVIAPAGPIADFGDASASRTHVPVTDRDWTWEQIVDAVDDYFRIEHERPVQLVGDILTEGRIDTFPRIGATVVEPHRRDSVGRYNRWESTFQTIRRRAAIRVIPDANGYLVEVAVDKELEDLPRPEHSTTGVATLRNDSSLPSTLTERVSPTRLGSQWILLGRDPPLEQRILADIQARLSPQATPTYAAP